MISSDPEEAPRTAEFDRIAQKLAEQKEDGTVRRFEDLSVLRAAGSAVQGCVEIVEPAVEGGVDV